MNLKAKSYSFVSAIANLNTFSGLLTQAVSGIASIQQTQTSDKPEKWGITSKYHDYCYGRRQFALHLGSLSRPGQLGRIRRDSGEVPGGYHSRFRLRPGRSGLYPLLRLRPPAGCGGGLRAARGLTVQGQHFREAGLYIKRRSEFI